MRKTERPRIRHLPEKEFGKRVSERFWLCEDFDIDTSNPDMYIMKNGKCEKINLYSAGH